MLVKLLPEVRAPASRSDADDLRAKLLEPYQQAVAADEASASDEASSIETAVCEFERQAEQTRQADSTTPDPLPANVVPMQKPSPPAPVTEAEKQARVDAVNADKSAYTQQGLRPATHDEPWRSYVQGGGYEPTGIWLDRINRRAW